MISDVYEPREKAKDSRHPFKCCEQLKVTMQMDIFTSAGNVSSE